MAEMFIITAVRIQMRTLIQINRINERGIVLYFKHLPRVDFAHDCLMMLLKYEINNEEYLKFNGTKRKSNLQDIMKNW